MMKILLLGKNGQVGWELQRSLAPLGQMVALDRTGDQGLVGDLSDLGGLMRTLRKLKPDIVVNAAAYTAVDRAEGEPEQAMRINAEAPRVLAETLAEWDGWLIHYSTDYVFDGSGSQPWREDEKPSPLNAYGRSKLFGEQAIRCAGCNYLIFRTSWVYGARGSNFAKSILRLATEREYLKVVDDQVGAPTGAELLADVTAHAIRSVRVNSGAGGLYHLAAGGETSWYGYARFVIEQMEGHAGNILVRDVEPVSTKEYSAPARRPLNSRLDCSKLRDVFGVHLPDWQSGVLRMLRELPEYRE